MKLINGVFFFLSLSLHLFSTSAICVPRNTSISLPPSASPPQSPIQSPPIKSPIQSPIKSPIQSPIKSPIQSPSPSSVPNSPRSFRSGMFQWFNGKLDSVKEKLPPSPVDTQLTNICKVTSNPQLCANSIKPNLQGAIEPTSALKTEIQQSIKEFQASIAKLKDLRTQPSTSDMKKECLSTCHENFSAAIDDLRAALESIDVNDFSRMESVLSGVMTDLTTCDDTFAELGEESPLDDLTTKMSKYASNCLAISKLLL